MLDQTLADQLLSHWAEWSQYDDAPKEPGNSMVWSLAQSGYRQTTVVVHADDDSMLAVDRTLAKVRQQSPQHFQIIRKYYVRGHTLPSHKIEPALRLFVALY
jgi:hypothetical protein